MTKDTAECWADNPGVALVAKRVEEMLAGLDDARAETKIEERNGYWRVKIICSIRLPKEPARGGGDT